MKDRNEQMKRIVKRAQASAYVQYWQEVLQQVPLRESIR